MRTESMPSGRTERAPEPALPGPWLRLAAFGAAAATALVIASAAAGFGRFHDLLSLIALAFLVAVAIASAIAYPYLRAPVAVALGAMLVQIALGGLIALSGTNTVLHVLHIAMAAVAFTATLVVAARVRWDRTPTQSSALTTSP